jgi:HNH endonuclease
MGRPNRALEDEVRRRAGGRCEYCKFPASAAELPFHIDHIIAEKHEGKTEAENLAWACFSCNLYKGSNIAGFDPITRVLTRLFHPRTDIWADHFVWSGSLLVGRTAIGRTTVAVLSINHPHSVGVRDALLDEGVSEL